MAKWIHLWRIYYVYIFNTMNQPNNQWEDEFDDKFGDKEGCQRFSDNCGKQLQPSGDFECHICQRWGGKEGIVKDWKRPIATTKQIKLFIYSLLQKQREELKEKIIT